LVEARNNWWGDASGPGGIGPGSGDEISGTIAFDPWLTKPECLTAPDDPALADLNVALMASSSSVPVGGVLTYTVTISNSGPQTATAVSLANQLPPEVTLVALPPNCTGTATLTCSLGSLPPNNPLTLTYQVRADGILSGVITNSATVAAAELDTFPTNNEATVSTNVLAPLVAFDTSAYSVTEGEETAVLTLSLNFAPVTTVTVHYATLAGTAEPGSDYLPASGTLTFLPGSTVRTVVIPIVDDGLVEGDETVLVALGSATNALLEDDMATLAILDNDQHYPLYLPLVNKP